MNEKQFTQQVMEMALSKGCQDARLIYNKNTQSAVTVRDNFVEKLQHSADTSLYFQLFCQGRYGSCSTNRMDLQEIGRLLDEAIEITRHLSTDLCRQLPPRELCYNGKGPSLEQNDPYWKQMDPEKKKEIALESAAQIFGKDPRILSISTEFADSSSFSYMIDSQGFEADCEQTFFSLTADCAAQDKGDARPSGWWSEGDLFCNRIPFAKCAQKAMEDCLGKMGSRKLSSGNYSMVVDWRVASSLLNPLLKALSGSALQQKKSFLQDKLHTKIGSSLLNLHDSPLLIGQNGARYFDSEGLATRPMDIFQNGELLNYYISYYDSLKMQIAPTIDEASLLLLPGGSGTAQNLIEQANTGIYVTELNGGNCNAVTGDFSYGIEGYYFENGQKAYPLHEMLISGKMLQLWQQLAALAADARKSSPYQIPSLLFQNIAFSGL